MRAARAAASGLDGARGLFAPGNRRSARFADALAAHVGCSPSKGATPAGFYAAVERDTTREASVAGVRDAGSGQTGCMLTYSAQAP